MIPVSKTKNSIAAIIATIIASMVTLRIGQKFLPGIPFTIQVAATAIGIVAVIIYLSLQKRKAKQGIRDTPDLVAFWRGVTRYFLAMDMIMFGLEKIFHLQFVIPLGVLDNPFSSLTGEQLIWAFYGKFYWFTVIIAALQISGAIMLQFNKTRLLALFVLLPVLLNIVLLDWFYDIGILVNTYITLLTIAAVYLLLADYARLKTFFFAYKTGDPVFNFKQSSLKNYFGISAIVIPVVFMASYKFPKSYPEIWGKYEINSPLANTISWPSATGCNKPLTKLFIDKGDFVFEFDNYKERFIGSYVYDDHTKEIKVTWRFPATEHDTLYAKITSANNDIRKLIGCMGNKNIQFEMKKVN